MKIFLFLVALLIQCIPSWAGLLPIWAGNPPRVPTLQPYRVASPDGMWLLDVKPSNREGSGTGMTTLTYKRTGKIMWRRMLPYTFWQCCVNNKGVVGGFAYTKGPAGGDTVKDAGHFIVSFLDVQGGLIHKESTRQDHSWLSSYDERKQSAYRLLFDEENDRMILIMSNRLFRCYSMRDGLLEVAFSPESEGDASGYRWAEEVYFIPNTRLMLLQSNVVSKNRTEAVSTSCIQLIDDRGRMLWATSQSKTFRADKEWPYPEFRIMGVEPLVPAGAMRDAAIAALTPHFTVYLGYTGEKVRFRVFDSGGNDEPVAYKVSETSRKKWTLPKELPNEGVPPADFPAIKVKKLASFQLKQADKTPLAGIAAIALGPKDTIHVIDEKTGLIHVFDKDGTFLHVCDPGEKYSLESKEHPFESNDYLSSITVDSKGGVFAKISDELGVLDKDKKDPHAGDYLHFTSDGALKGKPLASAPDEIFDKVVAQVDTNNLIFYGLRSELVVKKSDQDMRLVTTLTHRADGQWLDSIQDVACAPNGMIAVRDSSQVDTFEEYTTLFPRLPNHLPAETITIYTKEGTPLRTIDFSRFAGLTEIDFDGKHILATFPFDPPTPLLYLFDSKGTPIGAIQIAELADKKSVNLRAFIVSGGKGILAVDLESGMVFRYAMP